MGRVEHTRQGYILSNIVEPQKWYKMRTLKGIGFGVKYSATLTDDPAQIKLRSLDNSLYYLGASILNFGDS